MSARVCDEFSAPCTPRTQKLTRPRARACVFIIAADVRETHKVVIRHILSARKIPGLENATVVLVLESNLAFEAQHLVHALTLNRVPRWVALSEGAGGSIGWLTTNERKEAMCFQVRDALRVGCIGLSDKFFCNTMEVKEILIVLKDELRNFCVLVEAPKTPFGKGERNARACVHTHTTNYSKLRPRVRSDAHTQSRKRTVARSVVATTTWSS